MKKSVPRTRTAAYWWFTSRYGSQYIYWALFKNKSVFSHYYHLQHLCQHTTTNDEHNLTSTNYLLDTAAKTFVKQSGDRRPRRQIYQLSSGHSSEDTRETRRRPTNTPQRRHLKIEAAVDNLSLGVQYQRLLHVVLHARSITTDKKRFFLGPLVQSHCSEPTQVSLFPNCYILYVAPLKA
ncbi:hypothetical protein AGLY_008758 [Aphis glycines]|uniref:Uncharacterized protein n=1 Tax=Aphis glycines TaxID=307491 RepID=A0A6G0TJW0_APHGL|nr:hypothetical protein AGLY_008758 [Aphis glycines]